MSGHRGTDATHGGLTLTAASIEPAGAARACSCVAGPVSLHDGHCCLRAPAGTCHTAELAAVSAWRCVKCAKAITPDITDARGTPGDTAIWRDATSYGVCADGTGQTWHAPAGDHAAWRCCWLTACAVCDPMHAARYGGAP